MSPGRPRRYSDNATRQRAYRQRQAARSSPAAALIQACLTPESPGESWEAFISRVGFFLSASERQRDALDRTQAGLIVAAEQAAQQHAARPRGRREQIRRRLLADLRVWWTQTCLPHPKPTFLTYALKVADFNPDLFGKQSDAIAQSA
jgi:hypothetical protein